MNKTSKSIYYKTSLITLVITLSLFALAIPFFFFKLMEIPLGILLGGVFGALIYVVFGLFEGKKLSYTVVTLILKTLVFVGAFIGICVLYFKANIRIFNPFAFMAMYIIPTIVLIFVSRKGNR